MASKKKEKLVLTVRERIEELRRGERETQEELAVAIGVSRAIVGKWENDDGYNISSRDIVKLAEHFKVSGDYLLGLSEEKSPKISYQVINKITGLTKETIQAMKYTKETDHYLGARKDMVGKCNALSRALSSLEFLDTLADLMLISKNDESFSLPAVVGPQENKILGRHYTCILSPEAYFDYQSMRLISILREVREGETDNEKYKRIAEQIRVKEVSKDETDNEEVVKITELKRVARKANDKGA